MNLSKYTREEIVKSIADRIYRESEIFNTEHQSDLVIALILAELAREIENYEWLETTEV